MYYWDSIIYQVINNKFKRTEQSIDDTKDVKLTLKPIILTSGAHLAVAAIDTRMGLRKRTIISATNCTAFTSRIGPHIYVNQL